MYYYLLYVDVDVDIDMVDILDLVVYYLIVMMMLVNQVKYVFVDVEIYDN